MKKLKYSIFHCSSYSSSLTPENIIEDKPSDQSSRWSSGTNDFPQYIILKLDAPAILETVTFGKFEKAHICNVKKVKVFIGMTDACNLEVLKTGLKNDNQSETFGINYTLSEKRLPCLFVKIVPLICWGPTFNPSIWYVELGGSDEPSIIGPCLEWYRKFEETEVLKLCLKHFRQHGYYSAFKALTDETGVRLEAPCMTELYDLVTAGVYQQVEHYIDKAIKDGQFIDYIQKQVYRPNWESLTDVGGSRPGMRGGHQMCVDPYTETIYLLGGWDGHQDMGDFWMFHVPSARWTLISKDISLDGGPSPRSCHKMVLDTERRQLFVLGRYVDTQCRAVAPLLSDFYMYDIGTSTWTLITEDTAAMGGPQLLFDHQMCFDILKRTLYVFGGRVLTPPFRQDNIINQILCEVKFAGLYSYEVATNTWTLLCEDNGLWPEDNSILRSRVGHSMIFHPSQRKLYIFGGQRNKDYMQDLITYDVDSAVTVTVASQMYDQEGGAPSAGYTQRATLNPELDEIYILSGLSKDKEKRDDNIQYSLWVYSISHLKWTCLYKMEHVGEQYWSNVQRSEPCPRFAHQFVYDSVNKVHYLFGGNPGRSSMPKLRLDDFWKLHLTQPSEIQLMRRFKFLIRKHRFEEKALEDQVGALEYLQTAVYEVIDHDDIDQTKEFQLLTSVLFEAADTAKLVPRPVATLRNTLYNKLVEFFPSKIVQPKGDLVDILPLCLYHCKKGGK